jgi:hypothetical protein
LKCGVGEGGRRLVGPIIKKKVLCRVKEERNILHIMKRRKAEWIDLILRRNCLLKNVTGEKIGGNIIRGRKRRQSVDDIKVTRSYWNLKDC